MKIIIDKKHYDIECNQGEEQLLRDAEKIINIKIEELPDKENLSESKKFLLISLMLAGDLKLIKNFIEDTDKDLDLVDTEILSLKKRLENLDE